MEATLTTVRETALRLGAVEDLESIWLRLSETSFHSHLLLTPMQGRARVAWTVTSQGYLPQACPHAPTAFLSGSGQSVVCFTDLHPIHSFLSAPHTSVQEARGMAKPICHQGNHCLLSEDFGVSLTWITPYNIN